MQNIPPPERTPAGSDDLTVQAGHNQYPSEVPPPAASAYSEPEYKEYAPPGPERPVLPVPTRIPQGQQPPATPPLPPNNTYWPPVAQPGYIPPRPGPGYLPPTPQQGYVQPAPAPGYIPSTPQPGYLPPTPQPGYIPPVGQPGAGYPVPPGAQPARKPNMLALIGLLVALVVVMAIIIASISAVTRSPAQPTPTAVTHTRPTTSATSTVGQPTSAFQSASCPFKVGTGLSEGKQVSCGYVTVPADHNVKNGATIKLAVAIFKAKQYMDTPDPTPVLRLDGGPGGPSLPGWATAPNAGNYSQFIFNHDLVMFDQRGTGFSTPSLKCPELIALQYVSNVDNPTYEKAAHTCYDRLLSQNINLSDFNSLQNAADVSDLIHALGYQQMTLYGVSYGTRLALTVMHLHPDVVHAAVLDSVYPTNHNRNELTSDAQHIFNVLFDGCTKSTTCNTKYPDLQNVFYSQVDALNAQPAQFSTTDAENGNQYNVTLNGDGLVSWLFSMFYFTDGIPLLPQTIYQIKNHDYTQLAYLYGIVTYDSTFSDGMFLSTTCSEDWAFLKQSDIAASEQGIDAHINKVFGNDEQQEYDICQFWKVNPMPATQKQPVVSNLPALVVTGEYDPITPPNLGQDAASHLSHSYFFTFPGQGHGQEYSSACSNLVISQFEDNANVKPDGSCIQQMPEPNFA